MTFNLFFDKNHTGQLGRPPSSQTSSSCLSGNIGQSPSATTTSTQQNTNQQQQQQQQSPYNVYHYLTPPSQHSGGVTPQHLVPTLDSYPTPSPESPGHWSSSSPHSNSDWSEGIQSPTNTYMTGGHQTNKGGEAIYI